jgi:hypothetical protein
MKKLEMINLTPHEINLCGTKIAASGKEARVAVTRVNVDLVEICGMFVPIGTDTVGEVTGLPPEQDGVGYIVSLAVRKELPQRKDIYSPADILRDKDGKVIGCGSFDRNI